MKSMNAVQVSTFINSMITLFSQSVLYAILAPFFPQEAKLKGATSIETGMTFGVLPLSVLVSSLIFGHFIGQIGPKFMYCSGLFVASGSSILFGLLEYSPTGRVFVWTAFLLRVIEGMGAGAFMTASLTIVCKVFPDRVASTIGTLEFFTGLGCMLGPVIGGALYQAGGFKLPFFVLGACFMAVSAISIWLLPSFPISGARQGSMLTLLQMPPILLSGWLFVAGAGSIGFLDVALGNHLYAVFNLSPVIIGLLFSIEPALYGVSTVVYGAIVDRKPSLSGPVICTGYCIGAIGLMLLGPAPFIPIRSDLLWLVICSLVMIGLGFGTLVSSYRISTDTLHASGYEESIENFGLLNGYINACFSMGAVVGPLAGGALVDSFGFAWAAFSFGVILALSAGLALVYALCPQSTAKAQQPHLRECETAPLLPSKV